MEATQADKEIKIDKLLLTCNGPGQRIHPGEQAMETWEELTNWPFILTVAAVFLLIIWQPLQDKYRIWRLKRAFKLRDRANR
jgi:hypothetical protein